MSTEPEVIEEEAAPSFQEYQVSVDGLGDVTIIDPQGEPGYRVRLPDGQVTAYPAQSGTPSEESAASDIEYAIANPTPASPDQVWAEKLAGVIVDPVSGLGFKANESTKRKLAEALILWRELEIEGDIEDSITQTIWDADNVAHEKTVAEWRPILLRYGVAWQAMHAQFAP